MFGTTCIRTVRPSDVNWYACPSQLRITSWPWSLSADVSLLQVVSSKTFERSGGQTVIREAVKKKDFKLLRRISGVDLFACEAMYNLSCQQKYLNKPEYYRSKDVSQVRERSKMETAYRQAFERVWEVVKDNILAKQKVLKMTN